MSERNELLARAWRNECDGWLALGCLAGSNYRVERHGSVTCAWWEGAPKAIDNYLMIGDDYAGDLQPVIASVAKRIEWSSSPTVIRFIDNGNGGRWTEQAEQLGFVHAGAVPVMACLLQGGRPSVHIGSAVTTRMVEDRPSYQEALQVIHAVYGGDLAITRFFNPYEALRFYTGHWEGAPASSVTVWPFAGVAGIYSVATLPEYRRRGLALAVIQHALNDAAADGYDLAILRTMDDLVPFYAKLGFQLVGRVYSFSSQGG